MITRDKLNIYKKYNGNGDAWARSGRKKERAIMEDKDWSMIERFIQDLKLIEKGLAAEVYINDVHNRMTDNCDSTETIEEIKAMLNDTPDPAQRVTFIGKVLNMFSAKK